MFSPLWFYEDDPAVFAVLCAALGDARMARQYPVQRLQAAGVHVSFGSDYPVTSDCPLQAICAAVTEMPASGELGEDGVW